MRVTKAAICGSDLHLYHNLIPIPKGLTLGHELMGIVEAVGPDVTAVRPGDRVVVGAPIACGSCVYCQQELYSLCYESNPEGITCGIYGYGTLYGPYQGGQAEYLRVPYANLGLLKVPDELADEQALFMGDNLATGWYAALCAGVEKGDDVVVMGCGPVGLLSMQCAYLQGARRVFAVDHLSYRLEAAAELCGAEPINLLEVDVSRAVEERTEGKGAHCAIDAVGMQATMTTLERVKTALRLDHGSVAALRQAVESVRRGGRIAIIGDYGVSNDNVPIGHIMNKGLTIRTGQTPVQRFWPELLDHVKAGRLHPEKIITHQMPLDEAPKGYHIFDKKEDGCIKVVLEP